MASNRHTRRQSAGTSQNVVNFGSPDSRHSSQEVHARRQTQVQQGSAASIHSSLTSGDVLNTPNSSGSPSSPRQADRNSQRSRRPSHSSPRQVQQHFHPQAGGSANRLPSTHSLSSIHSNLTSIDSALIEEAIATGIYLDRSTLSSLNNVDDDHHSSVGPRRTTDGEAAALEIVRSTGTEQRSLEGSGRPRELPPSPRADQEGVDETESLPMSLNEDPAPGNPSNDHQHQQRSVRRRASDIFRRFFRRDHGTRSRHRDPRR